MSSIEEVKVVWDDRIVPLKLDEARIGTVFVPPPTMEQADIRRLIDSFLHSGDGQAMPAITAYLLPDDTLALPVSGRPQDVMQVLGPLVNAFTQSGVEPQRINVVCDSADASDYRECLPQSIKVVPHSADVEENSGYLANTQRGSRVYLNRTILESDLILPVIVAEPVGEGPRKGFLAGFWPHFSRNETQTKLTVDFRDHSTKVRREIAEVPWLAGVHGAIAAVPGANGAAEIHFVAPADLQRVVYDRLERLWSFTVDDSTDSALLIADDPQGLSENRLRSLLVLARRLASQHRKIALCLKLDQKTLSVLEREAIATNTRNCGLLGEMRKLGRSANVSFLGNLPDEIADDTDIVLLEEPGDLQRLVNRSGRWLVVSEAWGARAHWAD